MNGERSPNFQIELLAAFMGISSLSEMNLSPLLEHRAREPSFCRHVYHVFSNANYSKSRVMSCGPFSHDAAHIFSLKKSILISQHFVRDSPRQVKVNLVTMKFTILLELIEFSTP